MHRRSERIEVDALVIGAGPAGLMAADVISRAGRSVLVAEQKPSVARKFLMAGKSGLNLTRSEDLAGLRAAYGAGAGPVPDLVARFGPDRVRAWAEALGVELFEGSTGRIFPVGMKGSPLLRAWLADLRGRGVTIRPRWRWTGAAFETPEGPRAVEARATVLALGGASWRRLGSDGAWAEGLRAAGIAVRDFAPANAGLSVRWSAHMTPHLGRPVKSARLRAGATESRAEFVVSERGLEGGGIYALSRAVREGAPLHLDLKPDWSAAHLAERLAAARGAIGNRLRKGARLDPVSAALLMEFARPLPRGADLAHRIKDLPVPHDGLRPLDEAISTAGGLAWSELDDALMLRARPGTFAAGEMLDWEAPTGGYLLTACLATGHHAGQGVLRRLAAG